MDAQDTTTYTLEEVASHKADHWLAYKGKVFNLAEFVNEHPGGLEAICRGTGQDATANVQSITHFPHEEKVDGLIAQYCIGSLSQ